MRPNIHDDPTFLTNSHVNEATVYEAAAENLGLEDQLQVYDDAYDVSGNLLSNMCALHFTGADRSVLPGFWNEVHRIRDIRSR